MQNIFGFFFMLANLSLFGNSLDYCQNQPSETHTFLELQVEQEINKLRDTQDPDLDPSIEYLWTLSASNSYLRKFTFKNCTDLEDDYNRMQLAISTAKKIAALKAHVKLEELNLEILRRCGPKIIYNGSEEQNKDLKQALEDSIKDYPKENFIILDLPKDEVNTKGQFLSLKQSLLINDVSIGIITHAYHFPRISRMLGKDAPLYPFGANVKKYTFLVDRCFQSSGIQSRIRDEIKKIPIYILKGDLAQYQASDVIYRKL
jgi:hypothetical protein